MKKTYLILVCLIVAVFAFTSCATAKEEIGKTPVSTVLGKDGTPRPEWVTSSFKSEGFHFESGYGKMSNFNSSRKRAETESKNSIAEWVSTRVKEIVSTYVNDAGSGDNRQALDAMETISVQIAEATLSGVFTEAIWEDAEGGVWALVGVPVDSVKAGFATAKTEVDQLFKQNDAAAAANEKMQQAIDKLLKSDL